MIPQTLVNMNLFVDGKGFAGLATTLTPPTLTIKKEEHRAAGMDAPVNMDVGMEAMEASFALSGISTDVLKFFGLADQTAFGAVFRGAFKDLKGAVVAAEVTTRGMLSEINPGDWKSGEKAEATHAVACTYYKLEVDGEVIHEIDVLGMVRMINGVDQLAAVRAAIGL